MKRVIDDIGVFQDVDPHRVSEYLGARSWHLHYRSELIENWLKEAHGEKFSLQLPLDRELDDFAESMSRALQRIADAESRSQLDVLDDVRPREADIVRFRVPSPGYGIISLNEGAALPGIVRDLMLSAACATAVTGQAFFDRRKPREANAYLKHVQVGHEGGSYILSVISPLPKKDTSTVPVAESFERRVVQRLAHAMQTLSTATAEGPPGLEVKQTVDDGVTANLCEALFQFYKKSDSKTMKVSFDWSAFSPLPSQELNFTPKMLRRLEWVITILRSEVLADEFTLQGEIKEIKSLQRNYFGRITVLGDVRGTPQKVKIELAGKAYTTAREIGVESMIACTGSLLKKGNIFFLLKPRDFQQLQVPQ